MAEPIVVAEMPVGGDGSPLARRYLAAKFEDPSRSTEVAAEFADLVELPVTADVPVLIVPLPSSTPVASEFAHAVGVRFGIPVAPDVLSYVRDVPPVKDVPTEGRAELLDGALTAAPVAGTVMLVDDVVRTGATLAEAERALVAAGASSVMCVAMLRVR